MRNIPFIALLGLLAASAGCKQSGTSPKGLTGTFIRPDTTPVFIQGDTITITVSATPKGMQYNIERRVGTDYFEADVRDRYEVKNYLGKPGAQQNVIDVLQTEWHWIIDDKLGILQSGKRIYFRVQD
ncbi:hypothetical protein HB364_13770 [Pseudoflavitalea sp. X16]|uniref:hypothetical protein n=1 Tax=Paraflavitalea devenefica TaxID=2716334 RepID=UPI0014205F24|nr:hypothetical protein [Paraflavitalea devenefica]NII26156.1 hypothetical protein [Paraflavitalea devenefica]